MTTQYGDARDDFNICPFTSLVPVIAARIGWREGEDGPRGIHSWTLRYRYDTGKFQFVALYGYHVGGVPLCENELTALEHFTLSDIVKMAEEGKVIAEAVDVAMSFML